MIFLNDWMMGYSALHPFQYNVKLANHRGAGLTRKDLNKVRKWADENLKNFKGKCQDLL